MKRWRLYATTPCATIEHIYHTGRNDSLGQVMDKVRCSINYTDKVLPCPDIAEKILYIPTPIHILQNLFTNSDPGLASIPILPVISDTYPILH